MGAVQADDPMSGHTRGPWWIEEQTSHDDTGWNVMADAGNVAVSSEYPYFCINREADARLIAAAPDLLAALLDCIAALERDHPDIATQRNAAALNARAAIAKAEGK